MDILTKLTADPRNAVYVISGRTKINIETDLGCIPGLGLRLGFFLTVALKDILTLYLISAENGFYIKSQGEEWQQVYDNVDFSWKPTVKEVQYALTFCFFFPILFTFDAK